MKSCISLLFAIGLYFNLQAQTMSQSFGTVGTYVDVSTNPHEHLTAQSGGNFFQKRNIENNNDLGLPSYASTAENVDAYYTKDWVKGSVTTTDHITYDSNLVFMYDKINSKLYFRNPDSSTVMEADITKIISFSLITDKPYLFVKSDFFKGAEK